MMEFMGANPDFLDAADRLMAGDMAAVDDMRGRVRDAVQRVGADDAERVTEAVVEDLYRAATRSKRSHRDAAYLEHERTRHEIRDLSERTAVLRLTNLDEAGEWPRTALKDLAEKRPAEFSRLEALTGEWKDQTAVEEVIDGADRQRDLSEEAWVVLARLAERVGDWPRASTAWREAADRSRAPVRALVGAAITERLAENDEAAEGLLRRAEEIDAKHPRVLLERLGDDALPEEILGTLESASTDDAKLRSLIHSHRARANLLLGDTAGAADDVAEALRHDPEALQAAALEINVRLQRQRDSLLANAGVNADELRSIADRSLQLREKFVAMRRYQESCRLLMLAMDATALAGERDAVAELVRRASEEERRLGTGDHVLAESALRAVQWQAALDVLWPDREEDAERLRIRGQALSLSDDALARAEGIRLLETVALGDDGEQSELAAVTRVIRSIGDPSLPWIDEIEERAARHPDHSWAVRNAKALCHAAHGRLESAETLLPDRDDPHHARSALAVYSRANVLDKAADIAADMLEAGCPDRSLRVQCALAFQRVRDFSRMRAELRTVARDERAQKDVRLFAYGALFNYTEAIVTRHQLLEEWQRLEAEDPRLAAAWTRLDRQMRG